MRLRWFQRESRLSLIPKDTPLAEVRFVVLDTELTSLDARTNRLLSLGAIAMNGARILIGEQFYRVVNPGVEVPEEGVLIHKLRPTDVEQGQSPKNVLQEFREFAQNSLLVGHFAAIDMKVLRKELAQSGEELPNPAICTARVHRWIVQQQRYSEDQFHKLENVDLATLARVYGIEVSEAHHAFDDAFVTARLWQKLLHELEKSGIHNYGQLLKVGGI
ncbi:MAG TPA: 3'-5' exonuclease [Terriglobales bacterium]|nr:3'-5' exonuclease [Terriglobales bacterium]